MTRPTIIGIVAPLVMVAVLFVTLGGQRAGSGRTGQPAALQGTWVAKGVVESERGGDDQPVGTRLTRRWVFFTRCSGGRCTPWLAREAATGYEQARLDRVGDRLVAVFTRATEGCGTAQTGELTRSFSITPAAGGRSLRASEAEDGAYPGCTVSGADGHVESALSWTVTKASAACAGLRECREP